MLCTKAVSIDCFCTFTMDGSRQITVFVSCMRKMLPWETLQMQNALSIYTHYFSLLLLRWDWQLSTVIPITISPPQIPTKYSVGDLGSRPLSPPPPPLPQLSLQNTEAAIGSNQFRFIPLNSFHADGRKTGYCASLSLHTHNGFSLSLIFLC